MTTVSEHSAFFSGQFFDTQWKSAVRKNGPRGRAIPISHTETQGSYLSYRPNSKHTQACTCTDTHTHTLESRHLEVSASFETNQ